MKAILPALLFLAIFSYGQPKIVGTMSFHGQRYGGSIFRLDMPSTNPGLIHVFDNSIVHRPEGGVVAGDGDWLYGIATYNNTNNSGALYKIRRDGTGFTKLYNLENTTPFTTYIFPMPYYHTDGNIYFSTGPALKKMNPSTGIVTNIPLLGNGVYTRDLLIDDDDWIYYTPFSNTLEKIKTDGSQWQSLYTFDGTTEGYLGGPGLTEVPGDTIFGVRQGGGLHGGGILYSIKKDGTGYTIHHHFALPTGSLPVSKLQYFDGKLFGITTLGGADGSGVLYTINPDGSGYRVLHHFDNGNGNSGGLSGNISISSNGRIFGSYSQPYSSGFSNYRLFKVDTSGENFEPFYTIGSDIFGHYTQDVLLLDDETLFVPTQEIGRHDGGVLNRLDTLGSGIDLYHFGMSPNGFRPRAGVIKASNGRLYGATSFGGADGGGVIYSMTETGTGFQKLHEFTDAEGYEASGRLLEASDGRLYGACRYDRALSKGILYRINKDGTGFQVIYDFPDPVQGYSPVGSLVEDNAGVLYGAVFYGPSLGGIFKINKDGTGYTLLKDFNDPAGMGFSYDGLTIGGDYLYGSGGYGGPENKGGVFRIKKDGTGYEVLHEFVGATAGSLPTSPPIIASNGKLYGVTSYGGINGDGTLYSMDVTGANFTTLLNFSATVEGATPWGGIIQASDGWLYGGTNSSNMGVDLTGGTIYKIRLDGTGFTMLKAFNWITEGQGVTNVIDLNGLVLPVEFISFDAEKKTNKVLLTWKTVQEQNSDRFEIERANGGSFSAIGTVAAAGNSNSVISYSFTDNDPLAGINHYRLKQIDIDGKFIYSKTIPVEFEELNKLTIAPNPVNDQLTILLPRNNGFTTVRILDATGKTVLQRSIAASTRHTIDIQQLPKGWYILQLAGRETQQERFLKR